MTDAEVDEFLAGRRTMQVATLGPDGTIHLVAMWYGFLDGRPAFETFAKSQKVRNLERDPRITVLVEAGEAYEELRGVEMVGRAEIVRDPERLMECARSVVTRYWGVDSAADVDAMAQVLVAKRVAVVVHADKVVSWDHSKLGGAY